MARHLARSTNPRALQLIVGGREPKTVHAKALARALAGKSHDDAMEYMLHEVNDAISRTGLFRCGRLFFPGDITITHAAKYTITVRSSKHEVLVLEHADISHAILDLMSFWEEDSG